MVTSGWYTLSCANCCVHEFRHPRCDKMVYVKWQCSVGHCFCADVEQAVWHDKLKDLPGCNRPTLANLECWREFVNWLVFFSLRLLGTDSPRSHQRNMHSKNVVLARNLYLGIPGDERQSLPSNHSQVAWLCSRLHGWMVRIMVLLQHFNKIGVCRSTKNLDMNAHLPWYLKPPTSDTAFYICIKRCSECNNARPSIAFECSFCSLVETICDNVYLCGWTIFWAAKDGCRKRD